MSGLTHRAGARNPPRFGGVPLLDSDSDPRSGGAFGLVASPRESQSIGHEGWQVQVAPEFPSVIVRGGTEANYEDALQASLAIAQRGLDLMSVHGANDLVIKGIDEDHLIWWPDVSGLTIRAVSLAPITIDVPPVSVLVTDSQGRPKAQLPPSPPIWHESFRYFRLSQTSDDLFDAYRNAYLALESVLSSIAPQTPNAQGKVSEGEGAWFRRALAAANSLVPLASLVPAGTQDPLKYLFDDLFVDMRSAMSHSKSGRAILLPQDDAERRSVTESLGRLVSLYLKLAEAQLRVRRVGGGMFAGGFKMLFSSALDHMTVWVSADESAFDRSSPPALDPNTMRELDPSGQAESPRPFVLTRLWTAPAERLAELGFVRSVVGFHDSEAVSKAILDGRLELGTTARLEVSLGLRGTNTRLPKSRYLY